MPRARPTVPRTRSTSCSARRSMLRGGGNNIAQTGLATLAGSRWVGAGELWLDPLGDEAQEYDCTMTIGDGSVRYTWSHEGTPHEGVFTLSGGRASWSDSWHQPNAVECSELPEVPGLLALHHAYPASGARIGIGARPCPRGRVAS